MRGLWLRRNAVSAFLLFCVQGEDGGCGPRDRYICLQLCTRFRNFCTFIYNYHARTYNYGKTFCKMMILPPMAVFLFHLQV